MNSETEVVLEDRRWRACLDPERLVTRVMGATFAHSRLKSYDKSGVSFLFCSDARIQELNLRWMNKDAPTNVLSFPSVITSQVFNAKYLGDIAIAYETILSESRNENKSMEHHATHMLLHGLLHLMGFDHQDEEHAAIMESLESEILVSMGIEDPWAIYRDMDAGND